MEFEINEDDLLIELDNMIDDNFINIKDSISNYLGIKFYNLTHSGEEKAILEKKLFELCKQTLINYKELKTIFRYVDKKSESKSDKLSENEMDNLWKSIEVISDQMASDDENLDKIVAFINNLTYDISYHLFIGDISLNKRSNSYYQLKEDTLQKIKSKK